MVIVGTWDRCDDGITRPVVLARVPGADGISHTESFLVDTAADVTALSAELLRKLGLPGNGPLAGMSLQGIGGTSPHILVDTVLEFTRDDGGPARVQGKFAALTDPTAIDMSILGRDVLYHFDVIVSRRHDTVLLVTGNHRYQVTTS